MLRHAVLPWWDVPCSPASGSCGLMYQVHCSNFTGTVPNIPNMSAQIYALANNTCVPVLPDRLWNVHQHSPPLLHMRCLSDSLVPGCDHAAAALSTAGAHAIQTKLPRPGCLRRLTGTIPDFTATSLLILSLSNNSLTCARPGRPERWQHMSAADRPPAPLSCETEVSGQ